MRRNLLKPDWEAGLSISSLPIEHLQRLGIKGLILDDDGTLLPRHEDKLHKSVKIWIENAQRDFSLHLLSNNPSRKRISSVSKELDIQFTYKAAKPTKHALRKVLEKLQLEPKEIAIIGDRLFTDVLAGNRLDLYTVLVLPISTNGEPCRRSKTQLLEKIIAKCLGASRQ